MRRRPFDFRAGPHTWAALLLIALLAGALRFWQLGSLPPGLHYDEAFNDLIAVRVLRGQADPLFTTENNGEEPMHILLIALLYAVAGPTPLGGRLVSAASGVVTVLALYGLTVELFRNHGPGVARRLGLLSSLFLATWYWSFHYNRIGMEPSMVPMMAVLAMLFLWRALRTCRATDAVLAGVCVALAVYTYPSGRVVPLLAGLVVLYHALVLRQHRRRDLANYAVIALAGGLAMLPLVLALARYPEWFFLRMQQVTASTVGGVHPAQALWKGVGDTALGFFWLGDMNWRQNLPGRPMFDAVQFAALLIGVGVCIRQLKANPYWFLPIWAAAGLMPTVLTEFAPHFGRALGATPPLAIMAGLGTWRAAGWVRGRLRISGAEPGVRILAGAAVLGLACAYSGGLALNDYFNRWARSTELFSAFDVGLRDVGVYAASLPASEPTYISPVPGDWYTLAYMLDDRSARLRSFNGRECLVYPARTQQSTHFLIVVKPGEDERSLPRLETAFPAGRSAWQAMQLGTAYAVDFVVPAGVEAMGAPPQSGLADFGGQARLLGYALSGPAHADQSLTVTVWWQSHGRFSRDYTVFVHLFGPPRPADRSAVWAQHDTQPCGRAYATSRWEPGEIIVDDYRLDLPSDLAVGTYTLKIGLYDLEAGQRVPIVSMAVPVQDNVLTLGTIEVSAP